MTADDLTALGHTRTDFLLGHDAPTPLPVLDRVLAAPNHWSADALEYAARGRRMFTRGFEQVRPRLYVGGHFHMHVDEHVDFSDFTTHVVLLPAAGATFSQATVDLRTLEVTPFELAF